MMKKIMYVLAGLMAFHSCKIENDIPYPIEEANITAFEVEGLCSAPEGEATAGISTINRTVTLYVDDTVDLTDLRITRFTVSPGDAEISVDSNVCSDASRFPTSGFEIPDNLANTCVDFSESVEFTLTTYQDYVWTVNVTQVIDRQVDVVGMVNSVIDAENQRAIIYVSSEQSLSNIQVNRLNLEGPSGDVTPDPTTVHDFSSPQKFMVSRGWEPDVYREWTVYVYHTSEATSTSSVFPRTTSATLNGSIVSGKTPVIEYRQADASTWITLPPSNVSVNGSSYTANLTGLTGGVSYRYRVSVDGMISEEKGFSTVKAVALENGSFDDWSSETANNGRTLWKPWATSSFWDTGNRGATTVGDSNSIPTEETCNGSGRAALLSSKYVLVKFAAGNIFTGSYVRTDGANGVLSFGREFSSFPTKLRVNYKYTSSKINRVEGNNGLEYLEGRADSCHIYIALTDWDQPYEIRTRPSERQLFDKNDSHVIAYAEYVSGDSDTEYQQRDLVLDYRYTNRTPKYILIVASASKYGDYFTGGDSSKLLVDNFELIYE